MEAQYGGLKLPIWKNKQVHKLLFGNKIRKEMKMWVKNKTLLYLFISI